MKWHQVLKHLIHRAFESRRHGRNSKLWWSLRRQVIRRQKGRCYVSGKKCHRFHVHHLANASSNPELSLDINNLVALRPDIHRRYHKENGGYHKPCTAHHFMKWAKRVRREY